jgi:hypothetical protein
MIDESEISVLVPTYRQPALCLRAVSSALLTGAGEVLCSDNASGDGTADALRRLGDARLRVVVQAENVGLWRNHLALLREAARPWVKFLHADDVLAADGLRALAAHADSAVAVVSALPLYEDLGTGRLRSVFQLSRVRRWPSRDYLARMQVVGNELGTPSCTLFRADCLSREETAWANDLSADFVANVLAASRGDVVLVPAGPVIIGVHARQDGRTQAVSLAVTRLENTVRVLMDSPDLGVRKVAGVFGTAEALALLVNFASTLRRTGRWESSYLRGHRKVLGLARRGFGLRQASAVVRSLRWKYGRRQGLSLDAPPGN